MKKSLRKSPSSPAEVDAFLKQVCNLQGTSTVASERSRLAFAIDATASRQPAWDYACLIQGEMFKVVEKIGKLNVQLIYFRGLSEFCSSPWVSDSLTLKQQMSGVRCSAGRTQIMKVMEHLLHETRQIPVSAVVYIGDACEEPTGELFKLAGQLGVHKTPLFMFQEGADEVTTQVYQSIARLSGGAYCRFDSASVDVLSDLLSAVAVYATGGKKALEAFCRTKTPLLQDLTGQILR